MASTPQLSLGQYPCPLVDGLGRAHSLSETRFLDSSKGNTGTHLIGSCGLNAGATYGERSLGQPGIVKGSNHILIPTIL